MLKLIVASQGPYFPCDDVVLERWVCQVFDDLQELVANSVILKSRSFTHIPIMPEVALLKSREVQPRGQGHAERMSLGQRHLCGKSEIFQVNAY